MKLKLLFGLLSCLLLCFSPLIFAASSVWKVSSGKSHLYIGGTIHLLSQSDHPLPKEFNRAYQDAAKLYFETDMAALQSPLFQAKMLQALMLNNGQTLPQVLKKETYQQLSAFFKQRGMNAAQFSSLSPTGVSLMLATMEFQRLGISPLAGVDITLHQQAIADNKPTASLETPDEQIAFISKLGKGKDDEMILYTLRDLKQLSRVFSEMKGAWRRGDLKTLEKTILTELRTEFPSVHKSLVLDRNNAWMKKILPLLKTVDTEYVLVGVLHLVGKDGLLAQLRNEGYTVTPVTLNNPETPTPAKKSANAGLGTIKR